MKKQKVLVYLLLASFILISLVGCQASGADQSKAGETQAVSGASSAEDTAQGTKNSTSDQTYVFVTAVANLEYWNAHKKALKDACTELGVKYEFAGDEGIDVSKMSTILETMIAKKVSGIITPGHFPDAYKVIFQKAWDAGIPVVTVTADVPDSKRISFIGADFYEGGKAYCDTAAELIGQKGKVIIMNGKEAGDIASADLERGFNDQIKKYPDMQVVATLEDKVDANVGATVLASALQAHPDVSVVVGLDAASAIGACTALREAGKFGQIKVVASDRDEATLSLIKEGGVQATMCKKNYMEVYYAVKFLYDYVNNRVPIVADNKKSGVIAVPPYCNSGWMQINTQNVEDFLNYKY